MPPVGGRHRDRARRQARGGERRHAGDQRPTAQRPPWSLKVTVPSFGVALPAAKSLTVAMNVTDCPRAAEAVDALSAVRLATRTQHDSRCSRRPTWGRNRPGNRDLSGRPIRRPRRERALSAREATNVRGGTAIRAGAERAPDRSAERESRFDERSVARSRSGVGMANALRGLYDLLRAALPWSGPIGPSTVGPPTIVAAPTGIAATPATRMAMDVEGTARLPVSADRAALLLDRRARTFSMIAAALATKPWLGT